MVTPKDLKPPFSFENRRILLLDRVLYVPSYNVDYDSFKFPAWSSNELFNNEQPICVEYCSGNGDWVVERALEDLTTNWVAVERQFKRVRKIWAKMTNHKLKNLLIVCGEAMQVTRHYFPGTSFTGAYLNFPDPWPKTRHVKHRLIRPDFVEQVHRVLRPQAPFMLVTDDRPYADGFVHELNSHKGFEPKFPAPHYTHHFEGYGSSWFERLWREKERRIHYTPFSKCA